MMSDWLSAVLVPGPVQTWKFARILGSEISIGVLRLAPLIVILTVFPFASRGVGTLRISKELRDRKSTRLNSSHSQISYAVFCLKTKTPIPSHAHTLSSPCSLRAV